MIAICRHCSKSQGEPAAGVVLELLLHPRRQGAVSVHQQVRPAWRRQLHGQRPAARLADHRRAGHAGETRGAGAAGEDEAGDLPPGRRQVRGRPPTPGVPEVARPSRLVCDPVYWRASSREADVVLGEHRSVSATCMLEDTSALRLDARQDNASTLARSTRTRQCGNCISTVSR